jgi:hypothetical protein
VSGKPRLELLPYMALGSCLGLVAVSWVPLWEVEPPNGALSEMRHGTFWQFLGQLPQAVEHLGVPQTPEVVLTILPTVYLWDNVTTTLLVLAAGALLGSIAWWVRPPRRSDRPP